MITKNKVVSLHYRLSNSDQELLESSYEQEPMLYLHGAKNIIEGLEMQLDGKKPGDKFVAALTSHEAYGDYLDHLCQEVPMDAFGEYNDITPGMRFTAETDTGPHTVHVIEVKDETVIVDGNHPLAGQDLTFEIEILEVRDATEEEIEHGHVHDNDSGCQVH
jgi:FKBP-type peptidyl-prolyl cis-trans isomerase SlyD